MHNANDYIEESRHGLIDATRGISGDQWDFKPAPDRWSIAQILEHVVMTQELVLGPVCGRLASAPPAPAGHDPAVIDALVVERFGDRSKRFQGPEILTPAGQATPPEALERLNANCVRQVAYLESTPDLRQHAVESAPLKAMSGGVYQFMDGYQWMLALAAHTARHTAQILEVKADADYPVHHESQAIVA